MKIIGITGNSGSGKSTIARTIQEKIGGIIIDADEIARDMTCSKSKYLDEIVSVFGKQVVKDEKLDRQMMANIIFNDKNKKSQLDKITFRYVCDKIKKKIEETKQQYDYIILDVPLLFESKLDELCDCTVGVIASRNEKIDRICKRDNVDKDKAIKRLNSQLSEDYYLKRCNYIIDNSNNGCKDIDKIIIKLQ